MKSRFDSTRFDSSLIGMQWALRFILIVMAALALAACSDDPTGGSRAVVEVTVTAAAPLVEAGDSVLLTAKPKRADGTLKTDAQVSWMSTNTAIATVQGRAGQKAVVVGKQPGTVTIRAMADDKFGQTELQVIVTEAPAPEITEISPAVASEGDPLTTITVTGKNFNELSLIKWNDVAIATEFVSSTQLRGLVTPANLAQVGTAQVTVRTGPPGGGTSQAKPFTILGRVATVHLQIGEAVLWVGETKQWTATPRDQQGRDIPNRTVNWRTSDASVATVNANGLITPLKEGFAEVIATVDGKVASEGVYVVNAPPYDLMYDSNRANGIRELWIVSLGANPNPRRWLAEGFSGEDPVTNRDGTRIAFVSRDQFGNSDIWVANRDGSGLQRLTTYEGIDDNPAWSPDGTMIAFRSARGGQSQIWIMDADGSNQRNMMGTSYNVFDAAQHNPSFGTNGRLYFTITYPYNTPANVLASMPVNGTWEQVTIHSTDGYEDFDATVSWQGDRILLHRKKGGIDYGLLYTDLQGRPLISINYPGPGFMPSWSRNDQHLAYSSNSNGTNYGDIYVTKVHDFWRKKITVGEAVGIGRNPIFIKK